jgi:hypothetical protein
MMGVGASACNKLEQTLQSKADRQPRRGSHGIRHLVAPIIEPVPDSRALYECAAEFVVTAESTQLPDGFGRILCAFHQRANSRLCVRRSSTNALNSGQCDQKS